MTPDPNAHANALEGLVSYINSQWELLTTILLGGYSLDLDNTDPPFVWLEHRDESPFSYPSRRGDQRESLTDYVTRIPVSVWYVMQRTAGGQDILDLSKNIIEPFKLGLLKNDLQLDGSPTVTCVEIVSTDYSDKSEINAFFRELEIPLFAVGINCDLVIVE